MSHTINTRLLKESNHSRKYSKTSPFVVGLKRVFPNSITLCLELINVFIIGAFADTISKDPLLVGFMAVISAISGDIGLQTSSATIRIIEFTEYYLGCCGQIKRELISATIQGMILSTILGVVAFLWKYFSNTEEALIFGIVISVTSLASNICAGLMGTVTPLIFNNCSDPTHFAGPFETTFQDIIGFLVGLTLASFLL